MAEVSLLPTFSETEASLKLVQQFLPKTPLKPENGLSRLVGTTVFMKHEYVSPVNSFKARGALTLVNSLKRTREVERVVTASTGNHGSAMAYACQEFDLPITVVVPQGADSSKVKLIQDFGAELEFLGNDLDEAKGKILERSLPAGHLFIEDGAVPQIVAGTSTIGFEICEQLGNSIDAVVVPVGNGSLIGGIGTAIKKMAPSVKIIGVQSEAAPCMTYSYQQKKPINTKSCRTFASGIAVRVAIPEAVELMMEVVDEMVLVTERQIKIAMGNLYSISGVILEGAGAAALAGALKLRKNLRGKTVCLIASGSNIDKSLRCEILNDYIPKNRVNND